MVAFVRIFVFSVLLLTVGGLTAGAQTSPPAGTLEMPAHKPRNEPAKKPSTAPRVAVHKDGPAKKTPVVPPHGAVHPKKAPVSTTSAKQPPPVVPPPPPAAPKDAGTEKPSDPAKPEGAAVKLPRFASLRADVVNMRVGPGTRYRIEWVYKRRDLPVEIEREFDVWRWVRDADGIRGWVHQATLMGRRNFIVQKTDATLRSEASETSSAVAILKPGVIGRIRTCQASSDWCNVQTGSYRGYLRREQFWGLLPGEAIP
jgi:SH3-like domain-containing protein